MRRVRGGEETRREWGPVNDKFQDTGEVINEVMNLMICRIRNQHEILKKCRDALEKSERETLDRSEIDAVLSKMNSESEEFERRFGIQKTVASESESERQIETTMA